MGGGRGCRLCRSAGYVAFHMSVSSRVLECVRLFIGAKSPSLCITGRSWRYTPAYPPPALTSVTAHPALLLPAGLPPLPPPEQRIDYPLLIRLRQAAVVLFWLAVYLLAVVPATLRALRYAYLALGATAGPAATALLVTWTAASLWACSQPVDVRACSGKPVAVKEAEAPALAAAPPNATASKAPTAAPA